MSKVLLKPGKFLESQKIGEQVVLKLDPDRLLAPFYEAVNKAPKAPRYGGWEAKGISGHTLGHYLTALALMFESTGSVVAKNRAKYIVSELKSLQDSEGYVCGFPKKEGFMGVFENPEGFTSAGFDLAGWWVPYYTLHKIFRGLIDCAEILGDDDALTVAHNLGVWVYNTTSALNDEQRRRVLKCEYGSMNGVLSTLYRLTGDERMKKASYFFCEEELLLPLSQGEDVLSGLHANTQIPKLIGAVEMYENGGDNYLLDSARFFYKTVTENRSYIIGGHSSAEHFTEIGTEPLTNNSCETCNSNNMLTLARKLYAGEHKKEYYDFCERVIYNHILASQDETGMKTYYVGMTPGHFKVFSTLEESFWCCFGSGLENPFTYNRHIYYWDKALYINLFIASVFENEDIKVSMDAEIPESNKVKITVIKNNGKSIFIRNPAFSQNTQIEYEGEVNRGEGYFEIIAPKEGDVIEITLDMQFTLYEKKDEKGMVGFYYGPIALCQDLGRESFPETDRVAGENDLTKYPVIEVKPLNVLEMPVKTQNPCVYRLPQNGIELIPFYSVMHTRQRLYFKVNSL